MAAQNPPGRPGNLTAEQEEKLRQLWVAVFQTTGVKDSEPPQVDVPATADAEPETPKKKRFGLFRKDKSKTSGTETPPKDATDEDKYGQTAKYHETLANHSPESIRETIWTMVKHDHPDALVLRFLRARKWDVEKALVMLVSTMNWRQTEMHLDDDIMKKGEGGAVEDETSATDEKLKTVGHDFLEQIRMGKSFLHGQDKEGRPICYVRVRLHKQGEQCEESLERYTVYLIETARMVLSPPVDTATIVFDMTGFSMANMDYTPVKFMIKCFEANYPESLGTVLINNAPWVFQGIWKIIKGWLDPVVASKVHFTNNKNDMSEFIAPSQILKELGGDEDWEYKYVEPVAGENVKMKDVETRDRLVKAREELVKEFEAETLKWIKTPEGEEGKKIKARRDELAAKLKVDYWNLDPYVRARSLYDRTGALKSDGNVDWYAVKKEETNGTAAPETSADDVD
ncbi:CRAL/TRIO domain-containing protein [Sarocladium strictum]